MVSKLSSADLLHFVASRIEVGILAVDLEMKVVVWNRFLEAHSGKSASEIVGRSLFEAFPELPRAWLGRKVKRVVKPKVFSTTTLFFLRLSTARASSGKALKGDRPRSLTGPLPLGSS